MELLLLILPVISICLLHWWFRDKKLIPVYLGALGISVILMICLEFGMRYGNFDDTEFLSYHYVKGRYLESWNEYIHRTCTKKVKCGVDKNGNAVYKTVKYDCSYVDNHPERWILYDNCGRENYVDRRYFHQVINKWGGEKGNFVEMNRRYYTKDGDAYDWFWKGNWKTCETYTVKHSYENRILGSKSILGYREIDKKEAKMLGLLEYPIDPNIPVVGIYSPTRQEIQKLQWINGVYGKTKQFHTVVFIYPSELGVQIFEDQIAYFKGPNKNELLIGIFLNKDNTIQAADVRSWQESPLLDIKCRNFILEQKKINLIELGDWIVKNLGDWKRREFKEFEYISTYLKPDQVNIIMWVMLILSIIIPVTVIIIKIKQNE